MPYEGEPIRAESPYPNTVGPILANPRPISGVDSALLRLGDAETRLSAGLAELADKLQPVWLCPPEPPTGLLAVLDEQHSPHVASLHDHAVIVERLAERVSEMLRSIEL